MSEGSIADPRETPGPFERTTLDDFRLAWRFATPHHDLPEDDRSAIRPLRAGSAGALMAWVGALHGRGYADRFEDVAERGVDGRFTPDHEDPVTRWLDELLPTAPERVLVSYDEHTALEVTRDVLVRWWGAFLYPVEDVIIVPADASWTLAWDVKQTLYFARTRGEDSG